MAPGGPRKRVKPNPSNNESSANDVATAQAPQPSEDTSAEEVEVKVNKGINKDAKNSENRGVRAFPRL